MKRTDNLTATLLLNREREVDMTEAQNLILLLL